jgi:hypothetical protein
MAVVIPDISPQGLLGRLRGRVVDVHPAYPETIHLELTDHHGGEWYLSTHDADYSPSDPDVLRGKIVVSADLEGPLGNLTIGFSDGTAFRVTVQPQESPKDPVNWRLYTPDGVVLVYGPGGSWRFRRRTDPVF